MKEKKMSENQEEKWKIDMKALVEEAVDKKLKEWKPPTVSPPSSEHKHNETQKTAEHKHFTIGDDICPDCYPQVKKAVIDREFKGSDAECVDCGLPTHLSDAKKIDWECPSCGGKYAKPKK